MKKYAALAATASFSAATLVGCGGGDDDFCDDVTESDIVLFGEADPTDPDSLTRAADRFDELAGEAPDDLRDSLETAHGVIQQMAEANGDPEALADVDVAALQQAGQNIQQWAQENC